MSMDAPVAAGRRDRKRSATRQALHEAALRLAVERGLGDVTVEEIADAAVVSRRTFFNYFASKEDAVLYGDLQRLRRLIDLVAARPVDEPPWTSLRHAGEQLVSEADSLDMIWRDRRRLLRRDPSLAAHQLAAYSGIEREIAEEVARRMPGEDDLHSRVLAARLTCCLRVATSYWLEGSERSLPEVTRAALAYSPVG